MTSNFRIANRVELDQVVGGPYLDDRGVVQFINGTFCVIEWNPSTSHERGGVASYTIPCHDVRERPAGITGKGEYVYVGDTVYFCDSTIDKQKPDGITCIKAPDSNFGMIPTDLGWLPGHAVTLKKQTTTTKWVVLMLTESDERYVCGPLYDTEEEAREEAKRMFRQEGTDVATISWNG